ncbi:MAG: pyruvate, water dikinase regulatory protein [Pseudomonadota bacterium]
MTQPVFVLSDHTGITVESLTKALLGQFDGADAHCVVYPFLDTPDKVADIIREINQVGQAQQVQPLVYSSMVDEGLRAQLLSCQARVFDIFDTFLPALSQSLHLPSGSHVGRAHGMGDSATYDQRVAAVNFALQFDDGARIKGLEQADLILIGVSRSGKTPTCLYMAMQYKVRAANYPLTEEDLFAEHLPVPLRSLKAKLIGLDITPDRLHHIREERRARSHYADLAQCRRETKAAKALYDNHQIPYISSTDYSIEELATAILQVRKVARVVQ